MKLKNKEDSYIIEDIDSFCSSVQIDIPVYANRTFSIDELGSVYCKSVVEQDEGK